MVVTRDERFWPPNDTCQIQVYLPNDYWDSNERYPVTYVLDGTNLFSPVQEVSLPQADGAKASEDALPANNAPVDEEKPKKRAGTKPAKAQQSTKEPENKTKVQPFKTLPNWRLEQFLDNWSKRMIVVALERQTGIPATTADNSDPVDLIEKRIKPHIDAKLRTWSHREATAIVGTGSTGILALHAVFGHNEVFSKAGCLSCDLRDSNHLLTKELLSQEISPDTRVFLSWGERDLAATATSSHIVRDSPETRAATKIAQLLSARNASIYVTIQKNGGSDEESWGALAPSLMNFLWLDQRM